jgi:hypothetical protein
MSPASRTVLALSLLTLLGIVLSALLIHGALDRLRVRAVEANTDFVLTELREAMEASASLGLALRDVPVAQDLIERARFNSPDILAVEVFEVSGISLFNTDRGSIGEPVTGDWLEAIRLRDGRRWRLEQLGALVVGDEIRNDFGEPVGYVAITLSDAAGNAMDAEVLTALTLRGVLFGLAGMLAAGLIVAGLFKAATRDLRAVARELSGDGQAAAAADPDSLVLAATDVRGKIAATIQVVDAVAADVRALDKDEETHAPS